MYFKSGLLVVVGLAFYMLSLKIPVKLEPGNFKELTQVLRGGICLISGTVSLVGALICWPDGGGK